MTPREYWAFAFKTREDNISKEKRDVAMSPREYWAFAFKLRGDSVEKRATLETNCEQATEGVYCTYTTADIAAYGATGSTELETYCSTTADGVACFYPADVVASVYPIIYSTRDRLLTPKSNSKSEMHLQVFRRQ